MNSSDVVRRYLARLDVQGQVPISSKGLRAIHEAHLRTVPFENLSINMDEDVPLSHRAFAEKVALRRRGGICYELNGALYWLLKKLGFDVQLASSRVWSDGTLSFPGDHMIVLVTLDSRKSDVRIADVGFGAHSMKPLKLTKAGEQSDTTGTYVVRSVGAGGFDVLHEDQPVYRIEPGTRALQDFRAVYWWHRTSPEGHNTRRVTCSLPTDGGRITITGNRLIRTERGERTERELDDAALLAAYHDYFDIVLDDVPHPKFPPA